MEFKHTPVLLTECIQGLNIKKDGIYIDATLGGAGHSIEIAKKLSNDGLLIGIDKDISAINSSKQRLSSYSNIKYVNDNHDNIKQILNNLKIEKVDGILADLGVSSFQIDEETRGFSYTKNTNLDMRMNQEQSLSAAIVINTYEEEKLAQIFYEYGEERYSRQIAKKICEYRKNKSIDTTRELVEIIKSCIPVYKIEGHPAKRVFQAIRIEVNDEIKPLHNFVTNAIESLNSKGRLCIITFHSLEDRIVKNAYIQAQGKCTCPPDLPYCVCNNKSLGKIITKKPILPQEKEMEENSRSKSAKLRIFEKN